MQVNEIVDYVEQNGSRFIYTNLSNIEFSPGNIKLQGADLDLALDTASLKKLSTYLGIPKAFLPKLNDGLQTEIVNYFLNKDADNDVLLRYGNGNNFVNAYDGNAPIIPSEHIASAVEHVFNSEDRVRGLDLTNGIKVSVVTDQLTTEPRVGDVTEGGLRITANIGEVPVISTYLERLVCSNGMVVPSVTNQISLRGRTLEEIVDEMEFFAQKFLGENGEVEQALNNWSEMATIDVHDPIQIIRRFCREHNLGSRMERRLIERIDELEGNTYYDIINLITSMQHELNVSAAMRDALQLTGGLILSSEDVRHCNVCNHTLD